MGLAGAKAALVFVGPVDPALRSPVERTLVNAGAGRPLREAGIAQSMGSKGDCYDNAVCQAFHATLEKELVKGRAFRTRQQAKTAVFD